MGHRDHGRRNDVPTWDKVKTHFKKGQQLTVPVTLFSKILLNNIIIIILNEQNLISGLYNYETQTDNKRRNV
jgi:hypothetical protein